MTTTQDKLASISYFLCSLEQLLAPDDEDTIMDRLDCIEEEIQKIDRMQAQLALIIKLLGKNE